MVRRQHTFLAFVLLGAASIPSACTLPFAYIDDGSDGQAGDTNHSGGAGDLGTGAASADESGGSGAADSGGGGPGDGGAPAGGGGSGDGGSGGSGPDSGGNGSGGGSGGALPSGVVVVLDAVHQTIQGFGFSTAIAPSDTLPYSDLFTTNGPNAIGLSILRVGMQPDGSLYGYGIAEAKAANPEVKVIGTTWSPPAAWKDNGMTTNGGHLNLAYYDAWAQRIADFAQAQDLYAVSLGNAPDFASCPGVPVCTDAYDTTLYTAKEMVAFVKAAAPIIRASNPDTKIIAPEVMEWNHAWSNLSATGSLEASHPHSSDPLGCGCYSNTMTPDEPDCAQTCVDGNGYDYGHWLWDDPTAWDSFDIFGVQEYASQIAYAWPADVNGGAPDKEIWQTEMSGIEHWPEQGPSIDIDNGLVVAGWIHSALTVGEASAWLWWWYDAYYANDNQGLALTQLGSNIAKRYYTLGNYSKFVRPGFVAVEVVGNENADVLLSAYKGSSDEVVIVAINRSGTVVNVAISFYAGTAPVTLTPHLTWAGDNLAPQAAVSVSDDRFLATLPALSVTTFVGD